MFVSLFFPSRFSSFSCINLTAFRSVFCTQNLHLSPFDFLSIYLALYLPLHFSFLICLSVSLLYIYLCLCPFTSTSAFPSSSPSLPSSLSLSIYLYLTLYIRIFYIFLYAFFYLSIFLFCICLSLVHYGPSGVARGRRLSNDVYKYISLKIEGPSKRPSTGPLNL